jgi:hypothetical protein
VSILNKVEKEFLEEGSSLKLQSKFSTAIQYLIEKNRLLHKERNSETLLSEVFDPLEILGNEPTTDICYGFDTSVPLH